MRFPAFLDLVDTIDEVVPANTTLLALRIGQDYSLPLEFKLSDGVTAENLTGRTFRFVIAKKLQGVVNVYFIGTTEDALGYAGASSVDAPIPSNGTLIVTIVKAITATLAEGDYRYSVIETTGGVYEGMVEGALVVTVGF